jgi:hypothetical protein
MKHLAATTSLPFHQHDRNRSDESVTFSDALINHKENLQLFNDALDAETATLAEEVRTIESEFEEAISNANTKEEKNHVHSTIGKRRHRARMKLKKAMTTVYKTFATNGTGLSTDEIEAVELLCKMNENIQAKIPTLQQLDTLLGATLSEELKSALSVYNKAKNKFDKSDAKADFMYYLTRDLADELGRKATNESAKALAAKLADDYNKKYWQTTKGKDAIKRNTSAVSPREWFFPSFIRHAATAFNQLEVVDTVDENDEDIKKMSELLDDIGSAEGDERKKKINDFWMKTT